MFAVSDLLAELCSLLCGCGHHEKAFALFQAQLDFALFRPAVLGAGTPHKDAVDFMSVYWDSSVPKFGEDAYQGWAAWVETGGQHATSQFWYSKGKSITALATSGGRHNVMVWHLSVCPVGILIVTHQGTAWDMFCSVL